MTKIKISLIFFLFLIMAVDCDQRNKIFSPDYFSIIEHETQGFVDLPYNRLPNTKFDSISANKFIPPFDTDSIEMFQYRNMVSYHPVYLSQRARVFINAYIDSNNEKYLIRAKKYARKLMEISKVHKNAIYAPYMFRYSVHSDSSYTFEVPWFSGMAQGEMLTIFIRLYNITKRKEYLEISYRLLNSLFYLKDKDEIWISRIDTNNYFWIEEYPHNEFPGQTLNGFIYSIFGIYEFYKTTNEPSALQLYEICLTTLKHYLPDYNNDSGSYYCLGHKWQASQAYHNLHKNQMDELYNITGDSFFITMKNEFR
jgi:hypothetical protein